MMKIFAPFALALVALQQGQRASAHVLNQNEVDANPHGRKLKKTKAGKGAKKKGKNTKKCKVDKTSITGSYLGHDTEDGSEQKLEILCIDDLCDVTLNDLIFSTCFPVVGGFFGGLAVARDIPIDDLCDFELPLYCRAPNEALINYDAEPSAILTGNVLSSPGGGLFREGPGFYYYKTSDPDIKSLPSPEIDGAIDITGYYTGKDIEDGSSQLLSIFCGDSNSCDIAITDSSFSICTEVEGITFFRGVALATDVPRDELNDFQLQLYCLDTTQTDITDVDGPSSTLTGNIEILQDGLIRRTGPGFDYFKSVNPASPTGDFTQRVFGIDTEDGSIQFISLDCKEGFCDIVLADQSWGTCFEVRPEDSIGQGVAIARGVPQDNLDDFVLLLYCVSLSDLAVGNGIDYSTPTTTLTGNMDFIEDGIIRRTGPGFTYFNRFWEGSSTESISSGIYQGIKLFDSSPDFVFVTCDDGTCQVSLFNYIFGQCVGPTGNTIINGFGYARDVPEDALGSFDLDVYCTVRGQEIDFDNDSPTYTEVGFGLIPEDPPGVLTRLGTNPITKLYKYSSE